ncbi:uncharacterized protein PV09_07965 [Verruconis gallopava]|uniref:Autophagy-related protein 18 n=1 Tax=Verruconis gallopava TaxID=253628 RepID=A0A0D1XE33_9PEZI|nr:uncharacterized protein PV09_07965 [Verruconis gallopava]KIW00436.1 hypothetical protein PV09_07965 [Verruconis gallopava]
MSINSLTFNQDFTGIGVATSKGIRIYHTEPFTTSYTSQDGDISLMEMLYLSTLVAMVPAPRLLRLVNIKRGTTIVELTFPSKILGLRMNRNRLAVILEQNIHIYDIGNIKALYTIDTPPNPLALCALSPDKDKSILAYPCPLQQTPLPASVSTPSHVPPGSQEWHHAASQNVGDVRIYDAQTGQALNTIQAHKSAIGYLALNASGTLLATASEKGTIIRVFEVPGGSGNQPLFEFRRGTMPARIYHMSFNATSTLLCVSSASETVHIFKLVKPVKSDSMSPPTSPISTHRRTLSSSSRERSESVSSEDVADPSFASEDAPPSLERRSSGWSGAIASKLRQASQSVGAGMAARVGGYLPQSVTQGLEAQRDFAHVKIPRTHGSSGILRSIVAMSPNHPQLFVVTSEGQFGVYNIDLENGGDGVLERQHSILDPRGTMMYNTDD